MSRLDNYLIEQFTDINYNNLHSEQQVVIYEEFTVPKLNSDDSVITISGMLIGICIQSLFKFYCLLSDSYLVLLVYEFK